MSKLNLDEKLLGQVTTTLYFNIQVAGSISQFPEHQCASLIQRNTKALIDVLCVSPDITRLWAFLHTEDAINVATSLRKYLQTMEADQEVRGLAELADTFRAIGVPIGNKGSVAESPGVAIDVNFVADVTGTLFLNINDYFTLTEVGEMQRTFLIKQNTESLVYVVCMSPEVTRAWAQEHRAEASAVGKYLMRVVPDSAPVEGLPEIGQIFREISVSLGPSGSTSLAP